MSLRAGLLIASCVLILALVACGGGGGTSSAPPPTPSSTITSVSLTCSPSSIQTGQTSQCSAAVTGTGSFSSSVTWAVTSASVGTINSSGTFTGTAAGTATITATSTQDPTKSGSSTVTVTEAASISSISVSCASSNVDTGQTDQCTATVHGTGSYNQAVNWLVNALAGGSDSVGNISSAGVYTAPSTIPAGGNSVTIAAISQADSSKSGSTTVSLAYPAPILSSISPVSVASGSADTNIEVIGNNFTLQSFVTFGTQSLQTTYVSAGQLTAVIPSSQMVSPGTILVGVTTPSPGGGTSSGAAFTITPVVTASRLVIMATPVYSGSSNGPWQLSISAADSSGNTIPNLPVTLNSTEGTITSDGSSTDSNGILIATITPPQSYAGEPVTVSAASGSQTAVVNIVFADASPVLAEQAAALLTQYTTRLSDSPSFFQSSTTDSNADGQSVKQAIIGISSATNPFINDATSSESALCDSNAQLGTTIPVNCQSLYNTNQIHLNPLNSDKALCQTAGTVLGVGSCVGAGVVAVACANPETVAGPAICAAFVPNGVAASLGSNCVGYIASILVKALAGSGALKNAAGNVLITDIGLFQSANNVGNPLGQASDLLGVACNAVDTASAGSGDIDVNASKTTVALGGKVKLSTATGESVDWEVMSGAGNKSFGTLDVNSGPSTTYMAPSTYPTFCGIGTGFCGITISATRPHTSVKTLTVVSLVNGPSVPSPTISSLAPNRVTVGFSGLQSAIQRSQVFTGLSTNSNALQLAINGTGFLGNSTVTVNGSARDITYIGPNQLKILLTTADVTSAGQLSIAVSNPSSAGQAASAALPVVANQTPVPPLPLLQSPGSASSTGSQTNTTTPTMQWNGTGASQYELTISESQCDTNSLVYDSGAIAGGSTTQQIPTGYLKDGAEYCWRMRAYNSAGWSTWAAGMYFTVNTGSTASVSTPLSPGTSTDTDSPVTTATPTMQWTGTGASQYELAISHSPYGASNIVYDALLTGTSTSLSIPAGILLDGFKYRWNIRAYNDSGWSEWSPDLYFKVSLGSNGPPSVPTLESPGSTTDTGFQVTTTTPIMQWSGSGATTYELAISHDPYGEANLVYDSGLLSSTTTSLTIPSGYLQNGVKYRWDMQASNSAGQSSWSAPLYFTVNSGTQPLPAPTLLSPSNGATNQSTTPTFSWTNVSGNTGYKIMVATSSSALPTDPSVGTCSACTFTATANQNVTSYMPGSGVLAAGQTYYWEVHALTPTTNSAYGNWSSVFSFTTQ